MNEIELTAVRLFVGFGLAYFVLGIIDTIRWWNGCDENGNPK